MSSDLLVFITKTLFVKLGDLWYLANSISKTRQSSLSTITFIAYFDVSLKVYINVDC